MGALSSWAMLAFTHHFLVQASAWLSGHTHMDRLYTNYSILGDDLVLGDKVVADMYLKLLKSLGVKCGLHKSLISPKGTALEFAKKTFWLGKDVSPIPFREIAAATQTVSGFTAIVSKYGIPFHKALQAFGFGFQTYSNLNKSIGKMSSRARALILALNTPQTVEDVSKVFGMGAPKVSRFVVDAKAAAEAFITYELPRLRRKAHEIFVWSQSFSIWERSLHEADMLIARHSLSEIHDKIDEYTLQAQNKPSQWLTNKIKSLNEEIANFEERLPEIRILIAEAFVVYNATVYSPLMDKSTRLLRSIETLSKGIDSSIDQQFDLKFMKFIELSREMALLNKDPFSEIRVAESDGVKGLFDPIATRLWKRWTPLLQGSKSIAEMPKMDDFPLIHYRIGNNWIGNPSAGFTVQSEYNPPGSDNLSDSKG